MYLPFQKGDSILIPCSHRIMGHRRERHLEKGHSHGYSVQQRNRLLDSAWTLSLQAPPSLATQLGRNKEGVFCPSVLPISIPLPASGLPPPNQPGTLASFLCDLATSLILFKKDMLLIFSLIAKARFDHCRKCRN